MEHAVFESSSDRYVIAEYLAEGGMGAIYLGTRVSSDGRRDHSEEVVLKQLLPEYTQDPKFIDLFLREAKLSASLDHRNIVRTLDLVHEGSDYFMVMELVRGGDLRTLLRRARRRQRQFSARSALFIAIELLAALDYAHRKRMPSGEPLGLIHRDISPSNILISGNGEVKLTDFGIAKSMNEGSVFFKIKGKVGYMSPEQARGERIDRRTDLFSLGIVLYEMLVGERLFIGNLMSSPAMIFAQPVAPPSAKRPELPRELDAVVLRALSLDPPSRFQDALEFRAALVTLAQRLGLSGGSSELAADLRHTCGTDPGSWRLLDAISIPQGREGTAMVQTAVDADPFDERPASLSRPIQLPKKELTSVIKLYERSGETEALPLDSGEQPSQPMLIDTERSPIDPTRRPLEPMPSDPVTTVAAHQSIADRQEPFAARELVDRFALDRSVVSEPTRVFTPLPAMVPAAGIRSGRHSLSPPRRVRRLLMLLALLLVIGLGVAMGVAFSGPELDVINPAATTPSHRSRPPSELPEPTAPPVTTPMHTPSGATPIR